MGKAISFLLMLVFVLSCKKDKVFVCEGVSMSGDRSEFVGNWVWYETLVTEWFDIGPDVLHKYTPQNQGLQYYFVISLDGYYKGYRNDYLVHELRLDQVDFENFNSTSVRSMRFNYDCISNTISFSKYLLLFVSFTI